MPGRYQRVEIKNMAVGHVGSGQTISDEQERSAEARATNRYYDIALEATLRDYPWGFATAVRPLSLSTLCPTKEWQFFYNYPADAVTIRKLIPPESQQNQYREIAIPFKPYVHERKKLIGTNLETPEGAEVTLLVTDESLFPQDFVMALSYRLGMLIAPSLAKDNVRSLSDSLKKEYMMIVGKSESNSANEATVNFYTDDRRGLADSREGFGARRGYGTYDLEVD